MMNTCLYGALVMAGAFASPPASQLAVEGVLSVPSAQYPTIQSAIDAAPDGATVEVAPGAYFENLRLSDKPIAIVAAEGPEKTALVGHDAGPVVRIEAPEAQMVVLKGFSLRRAHPFGAELVHAEAKNLYVVNCAFDGGSASSGIGADVESIQLVGNAFHGGTQMVATHFAGRAEVTGNLFEDAGEARSTAQLQLPPGSEAAVARVRGNVFRTRSESDALMVPGLLDGATLHTEHNLFELR